MGSMQYNDGAFTAAMDLDTTPRSRLDFDEDDEIRGLNLPRQPRALSILYSPPTVSPDPEERARREARVCIRGDDEPDGTPALVVEHEFRAAPRRATLLRAAPIIGFAPLPLGLGVSPSEEQRASEARAAVVGRAFAEPTKTPKVRKSVPRALHRHAQDEPPRTRTGENQMKRPRRRWMMPRNGRDEHCGEIPCGAPTRQPLYSYIGSEWVDAPGTLALPVRLVTDDTVPCEHFMRAGSSMDVVDDAATPDFFEFAHSAASRVDQASGSSMAEAFRASL